MSIIPEPREPSRDQSTTIRVTVGPIADCAAHCPSPVDWQLSADTFVAVVHPGVFGGDPALKTNSAPAPQSPVRAVMVAR